MFEPHSSKHAIQKMAFAIEFQRPLEGPAFRAASALAKQLKSELPRKQEKRAVTFTFSESGEVSSGGRAVDDLGGVIFDRLRPDGEQELVLNFAPTHMAVINSQYEGWTQAWSVARNLLDLGWAAISQYTEISAFGLEYVDRFHWSGSVDEVMPAELFSADCPYIPSNCLSLSGPWHSFHGFYREDQLMNINTQFTVSDAGAEAAITLNHKISGRWSGAKIFSDGLVDEMMSRMHSLNKDVFRSMIVERIAREIGL
jgi:uncharacterized protein (TIGR04255 family)